MARHEKPTEQLTPFDHVKHELNTTRRKLMEETARADRAEVTVRNQEVELVRLRKELKEIKHRYDALGHWSR